jgi:hypothetical protein
MRRMFADAFALTVESMGTTVLAVGAGLFTFVVTTLIKIYREGWHSVRASWVSDAGWGIAVALVIWCGLFLFCLGRVIERRKQEAATAERPHALRDDVAILAGQLRHFIDERDASYDNQFNAPKTLYERAIETNENLIGDDTKREYRRTTAQRAHCASTLQEYGSRFAHRVLAAHRSLRDGGAEPNAIDALTQYPSTVADLTTIAKQLESAAKTLPDQNSGERGRRLNEGQKATIISSLSADVTALLNSFTDTSREELAKHRFPVRVVALGNDPETLAYRKQLTSAIEAAGNFKVFTEEWNPGPEEYESFLDCVTLLRPLNEQNRVRPMFLKALRAAGIEVREAAEPVVHGNRRSTKSDVMESARLVIGQRR